MDYYIWFLLHIPIGMSFGYMLRDMLVDLLDIRDDSDLWEDSKFIPLSTTESVVRVARYY